MTGFIPKEKLTAYQRWELEAFNERDASDAEELDFSTIVSASKQSEVIPKDSLTAYERWEGEAFDKPLVASVLPEPTEAVSEEPANDVPLETTEDSNEPHQEDEELSDDESELQTAIVLPTAAEIEQIRQLAHEQGYAEGRQAGHDDGWAEGAKDGLAEATKQLAEAQEDAKRINELLVSLNESLHAIDQRVADQLLATSLELSNQMIRHALRIQPELVLPVVKEALAVLNPGTAHPVLFLHPDDATLVRANLNDLLTHNHWKVFEDVTLTRGGCRIELGSGEVDATRQTRWRRLLESIGLNEEWLDKSPIN